MKFFRWLLSNIILIIIVIGLIYTYVYWGNLMGPGTPASKVVSYLSDEFVDVREFVNTVKVKDQQKDHLSDEKMSKSSQNIQHKSVQSKPVVETASKQESVNSSNHVMSSSPATELAANSVNNSEKTVLSKQKNQPQIATEQSAVSPSEANYYSASKELPQPGLAQQPAMINYSHNHQQMQQSSNEQALSTNNTTARNTMAFRNTSDQPSPQGTVEKGQTVQTKNNTSGIKKEIFVSPEVEKELKNAGAEGDVAAAAALTPSAIRTVWIEARKSFYRRDYALSEKHYKRVIAATKNNFDAYGELGNVYFNQGENNKAADAYMKAAVILVKLGQINRARSLLGLMQYLDKARAQQLEQKIDAAQ